MSFPQGTEMFHFPWYRSEALFYSDSSNGVLPRWVAPFGNLRVKESMPLTEAYRSLARPSSPAGT